MVASSSATRASACSMASGRPSSSRFSLKESRRSFVGAGLAGGSGLRASRALRASVSRRREASRACKRLAYSVWVAPTISGQITHRRLNGETLTLSSGAYVAHVGDVDMAMKFGGLKGLLAKEGAFFLNCSGVGDLWFNSYGGIHAIDVNGTYIVDNGHLVGYEGNLTFNIKSAGGGLMGFVASGEGMVAEFNGQGRVYIQSRNMGSLVSWLSGILPG